MGTILQKRLDWLNEARESDADLGFLGNLLTLCNLPSTGQGKRSRFARTNENFTLAMTGVGNTRFPCGNLTRPLLSGVIGDKAVFWRDHDRLIPSEIRLSRPFFDSTVRQPVPDHYQLPSRLAPVHAVPRSILVAHLPRLLAHRPACFDRGSCLHQHGAFPQKAGDNLTVRNYRKKSVSGSRRKSSSPGPSRTTPPSGGLSLHPTPPQVPDERDPDACP